MDSGQPHRQEAQVNAGSPQPHRVTTDRALEFFSEPEKVLTNEERRNSLWGADECQQRWKSGGTQRFSRRTGEDAKQMIEELNRLPPPPARRKRNKKAKVAARSQTTE